MTKMLETVTCLHTKKRLNVHLSKWWLFIFVLSIWCTLFNIVLEVTPLSFSCQDVWEACGSDVFCSTSTGDFESNCGSTSEKVDCTYSIKCNKMYSNHNTRTCVLKSILWHVKSKSVILCRIIVGLCVRNICPFFSFLIIFCPMLQLFR